MKKTITISAVSIGTAFIAPHLWALGLGSSDAVNYDYFGSAVGLSDNIGLVGAYSKGSSSGAVYLYRNLDRRSQATEDLKLAPSDLESYDYFGYSMGVSGNTAVIGAYGKDSYNVGAVYLYRNLDTRTQSTEDLKLTASDAAAGDNFGWSVGVSNNTALVGAYLKTGAGAIDSAGAVYLYRNLDTRTQSSEDLKLTASDAAMYDTFGSAVSISNNLGLVGAVNKQNGLGEGSAGAAYLYRNLDTRTQSTEDLKLVASDSVGNDQFGGTMDMSGNIAIIGAAGKKNADGKDLAGAAYLYRNLDTRTLSTEDLKLTASDAAIGDQFGKSVAVSGNTGLVGASRKANSAGDNLSGAAYLYLDLDTRTQSTEDVKITASDSSSNSGFGSSSALDGDSFLIGAQSHNTTGKAYTGSVKSITTLDDGTSKLISGISFESRMDWIVGENAGGNKVTLSAGDTANVMESGKAVYIGKNAGSNNNFLSIAGTLETEKAFIGSELGNTRNFLQFMDTADWSGVEKIYLTEGNGLMFEFLWSDTAELFDYLDETALYAYDSIANDWVLMDEANYLDYLIFLKTDLDGMLVMIGRPIPEPAACAAMFGALALACAFARRKRN